MKRLIPLLAATALGFASTVSASCPDYLNTSMRKLQSKDSVNFCEAYGGQPMLIVNTASGCGFTPQFKGLEALHQEYKDKGLVVIGFSSDSFFQEANEEGEVAKVCYEQYQVSFPMMATSPVKGDKANPVFKALAEAKSKPAWNFNKYLVDANGTVVEQFGSRVKPESDELRSAIDAVL